ncbi:MAG: MarR family transcriptional regulator [Peptococcaceae bacterium]|nr:MarR family transcriptional regulator [Peptococcaceae bacterium]
MIAQKDLYITAYRLINKYNAKTKQPKSFGTAQSVCGSEAQVLDVLSNEGDMSASRLAQTLGITKGAVSQTLAKLEAKNLVSRKSVHRGGNTTDICLTPAGKEILVNYYAYRNCRLRKVIATAQSLPPESAAAMVTMLEAFEEALDQY